MKTQQGPDTVQHLIHEAHKPYEEIPSGNHCSDGIFSLFIIQDISQVLENLSSRTLLCSDYENDCLECPGFGQ